MVEKLICLDKNIIVSRKHIIVSTLSTAPRWLHTTAVSAFAKVISMIIIASKLQNQFSNLRNVTSSAPPTFLFWFPFCPGKYRKIQVVFHFVLGQILNKASITRSSRSASPVAAIFLASHLLPNTEPSSRLTWVRHTK